ncbi:hypothetical protein L7F22_017485 [Adiantum nelumboides]|nr:hypothetical protein [Adiantum nelumboides]
MVGRGDMFQCYNCSEWGHKSPQCDKPKRMGGDMFPLPSQIPSRAQDYGIEIKGEAGPSGLTAEEKGKTKVVNIIRLDKGKDDINAMVMPVGKRTTREQETSDAGPSHKRGKQAETGTGKEKKKRKPRRHYNTSDFPLGEGQPKYNLRAYLVGRKADVTFGQLMEMCPRLKRQWKRMVNPMKNEPTKESVRVLSLNELPNICPTIDAWHKRKCIGEAYIDGGAQVCVITQACVTKLGLHMTKNSGFCIKLANQSRVRCLGIIKDLEVEVFDVKALVNCHVMPAGIGAFPLILGRPWLQATKAVQDWGHGTITLYNRSGDKKNFDMATKQSLDADFDEDDDDEEYSSSEEDDGEESSELDDSSDDSDVENAGDRLHGGAITSLVDIIGSAAIFSMGVPYSGVSVDINVTFMAGAPLGEEIEIEAKALRVGKTLAFVAVDIRLKATGKLVAQGRHTKFLGPSGTSVSRL